MTEERKITPDRTAGDAELIRAFINGDRTAFDSLVIAHRDRVFNLCYRLLGDYQEANDSAQETFLKAYRSIHRFRFEAAFSTWLYRIALNTCKNRLKSLEYRHKKRMVSIQNPGRTGNDATFSEIRDNGNSPGNQVERKEKMRRVQEAINALPQDQKMVVTLRDIQGFSYDEIADMTGLNLGTVKSKLSRARFGLREKLRGLV